MRWLMDLFGRLRHPPVDQDALRDEMAREDPEFARVRQVQHDAINAMSAQSAADGLAIRREREFWQRHGEHQ